MPHHCGRGLVIGHGNGMVTLVLQICTMVLYGVLLPCSILINSSEVKDFIVESKFYMRLIKWFGCQPIVYSTPEDEEDEVYNQKSHEDKRNNQDREEEDDYQENPEREENKNDGYLGKETKHKRNRFPDEEYWNPQIDYDEMYKGALQHEESASSILVIQDIETTNEF